MQKAAGARLSGPIVFAPGSSDDMARLVSALLTPRGLVAFWFFFAAAFVVMLWLVSPGRTLQDALTAELLQRHLAGGYQLRNPPLYEWLLWAVQRLTGPGPLSYLVLRYGLIAAAGVLFYAAARRVFSSVWCLCSCPGSWWWRCSSSAVAGSPHLRSAPRFLRLLKDKAVNPTREEIAIDWRTPVIGARRRSLWYLLRGDDVEATCRKLAVTGVQ